MEPGESWPPALDPLPLVLGRFPARAERRRASSAGGRDRGRLPARPAAGSRRSASAPACATTLASSSCPVCGERLRRPTPALFSFNSPLGACPTCQGFGRVIGIDRERVVPDPRRTPVASGRSRPGTRRPTRSSTTSSSPRRRKRGVPLDVAWRDLPPDDARVDLERRRASSPTSTTSSQWLGGAHLQGARARAARALPLLQPLPGLRRRPPASPRRWPCGSRARRCRELDRPLEHRGAARLAAPRERWTPPRARDRRPPARRDRRAPRGAAPGRARLPDARPPGAHPLGRRDAAHPSRGGAGLRPDQHPLRARRADHRPPPAGQRAPAPAAARPRGAGQHGAGGRARPHAHPRRRPRDRPRPGGRRARRPGGGRRAGRDDPARASESLTGRYLRERPADPGAAARGALPPRAAAGRRCAEEICRPGRGSRSAAPARTTCKRHRRRAPARRAGGGDRRLGLGQVDAGRERPLRHLPAGARRGGRRARRACDAHRSASRRWRT